jgi:hypothetical protein
MIGVADDNLALEENAPVGALAAIIWQALEQRRQVVGWEPGEVNGQVAPVGSAFWTHIRFVTRNSRHHRLLSVNLDYREAPLCTMESLTRPLS